MIPRPPFQPKGLDQENPLERMYSDFITGLFEIPPVDINAKQVERMATDIDKFLEKIPELNEKEKGRIMKNWLAGWVIYQAFSPLGEVVVQCPQLKNPEELRRLGFDPVEMMKFFILSATYPHGIDLNAESHVFQLDGDEGTINRMWEMVRRIIPSNRGKHFFPTGLIKQIGTPFLDPLYKRTDLGIVLMSLGFKKNPQGNNWVLQCKTWTDFARIITTPWEILASPPKN